MNEYKDLFNPLFLSRSSSCCEEDGGAPAPSGTLSKFPEDAAVTMAYVPFQQNQDVYDPELALNQGTLFPDLDKPFLGRPVSER